MKDHKNNIEAWLAEQGINLQYINGLSPVDQGQSMHGHIENHIGYIQVPVGVAGPILVHGSHGSTEQMIPLATTEGALVASYSRGLKACQLSGGITSKCVAAEVQRCPYFKFETLADATAFVQWVQENKAGFQAIVAQTSKHAVLTDVRFNQEGNAVNVTFGYQTGAASGQNMTTIATAYICKFIMESYPVKPTAFYIEGNFSGDKKGNIRALSSVRGKKVIAEVTLPKEVVKEVLKTTPGRICRFWQTGTLSGIQMGALGNYGHISNALTAIYLACGQDVATMSEGAVGIGRMEVTREGDLYCSLTCPNLIVGTIGGGTVLPTQREALAIMGCSTPEDSTKFAELCCAVALAGELSIGAAVAEGQFTQAHQKLGRKK